MNSSNFRVSLDMHESNSQATLHVKKGDTARKIFATLTERGKPYRITEDCSAVFTAKKPDGNILYNACVIQGNLVEYAMTPQTTAAIGELHCELRLYGNDSALITSPRFTILVDDTVYSEGDVVESSSEFSELTQLINQAKAVKEECEDLLETVGEANDEVEKILNGEGNIAVSSATANMLRLPHRDNGVVIYADTQEADVPVVYFEGERGDEPTILRGLAPPEKNDDAATKRYVDNAIIAVFGGIENVEEVAY